MNLGFWKKKKVKTDIDIVFRFNGWLNMHLQDVASGATSFPPSRLDQAHHLGFKVQRKATPS